MQRAEMEKLLTSNFEGIQNAKFYEDYVRIGAFLSEGINDQRLIRALMALEQELIDRLKAKFGGDATVAQSKGLEHFSKGVSKPKDATFSHLLTGVLDDFETEHGFKRPTAKVPIYISNVNPKAFLKGLEDKQHWKDIGASPTHGEHTHRIQWYLIIKADQDRVIQLAPPKEEADVFASLANFGQGKGGLFLWDELCDLDNWAAKTDFRSPFQLTNWLTGPGGPSVCPLLSVLLRARRGKRDVSPDMGAYLKKKGVDPNQFMADGAAIVQYAGHGYVPVPKSRA